ncbi:Mitochondr-Som1 domain-containing protein [Pyrenophora tritici-repentis]|nr:Mitochondr-Som1 domain-containing protein [Pyrenophora tritici-repentis]KAI0610914.1 Mitochondr-Som1 domain-containing protein [Pyrenophora tritici-repentis]PZD40590.1 Mitochondr-Som1 domain containing protein [Pyrenophora tritici-repentis]
MSPPLTMIHPSELEAAINVLPSGKPRKPPINLGDCELKELVQYKCNIQESKKEKDSE